MLDLLTPIANPTGHVDRRLGPVRGLDEGGDSVGLLETIGREVLRPRVLIAGAIALALVYVLARHALAINLVETGSDLRHAHPVLVLAGLTVFYLVYVVRAVRWRVLLANAGFTRSDGYPVPSVLGLARLLVVAAFANSVTVAQLGDAYRAYLLKKQARVSLAGSVGTILAERLTDLVVLVAMLSLAALVAFAGHLPHQAADVLVVGLALAAVGLAGIGGLRRMRPVASRMIPERWQDAYERFEIGTIASFRRIPLLLLTSALGWLIEGATIYLLAAAVAAPVSPAGAFVAGLVASLLSIEPLTPGGLGATEAGIVLVMRSLGVDPDTAAAVAVLNRVVNYLSLAVVGPLLYVAPGLSGLGMLLPWPRVSRPPTRRGRASAVDGETPSADLRPPEIVPAGRPGTSVSRHIRD